MLSIGVHFFRVRIAFQRSFKCICACSHILVQPPNEGLFSQDEADKGNVPGQEWRELRPPTGAVAVWLEKQVCLRGSQDLRTPARMPSPLHAAFRPNSLRGAPLPRTPRSPADLGGLCSTQESQGLADSFVDEMRARPAQPSRRKYRTALRD